MERKPGKSFNFGIKSSTLRTFVSSNNINLTIGSRINLNNDQLGSLITNATIYLECWLNTADIRRMINEGKTKPYADYQ